MSQDLKPCPFCGGEAEQRPVRDGTKTRCNRCSAYVVAFNGPDDPGGRKRSAEQWNRRAEGAPAAEGTYQARVHKWVVSCFGEEVAADGRERNHRFLEESLELVQSTGCTASEAHQLVDYVFGRDVGEPGQEVGGVMNTLAALCNAHGLDLEGEAEKELARVWTISDRIRAKHAAKPKHSPLPGSLSPPAAEGKEDVRSVRQWLLGLHGLDMDEVAADGGISVAMVVQQQAVEMAGRLGRYLSHPAPAAEPVAWRRRAMKNFPWTFTSHHLAAEDARLGGYEVEPLYASPPPEPVAISREDIEAALEAKIAEVGGAFLSTPEIVDALSKLSGYPLVEGEKG